MNRGTTGVNSLPKTVTRQRRGRDLNPGPSAPESSTLTTRLPSHPAPYARQSSMGYLYIFYLLTHRRSTCLRQGRGRCAASANDIGLHAGWRRPPGRAELGDSGRRRAVVGPRVHRGGGGEGARRRHPSVGDRHRSVTGRTVPWNCR